MHISSRPTWELEKAIPKRKKLEGAISADAAVIGGGMAGLLNAYLLAKAGKKVVLLEAEKVLTGVTLYTTAFLTQVVDTDAADMISIYGLNRARKVWQSHGEAISLIERIIKEEKIDCEFARCSNYIYANKEKEIKDLESERAALLKLGARAVLKRNNDLGIACAAYLEIKRQAKFHPLKFLSALLERIEASGGLIFEKSRVEKISGRKDIAVSGAGFKIKAKDVITATYQPFDNPFEVFLKKGMYKSYVLEAKLPKGKIKEGTYEDLDNPYHYFRVDRGPKSDRLIFGGEDHRQEIKLPERKAFESLELYLEGLLGYGKAKRYEITRRWSSLILEPADGLALIGEYDPHKLIATAFSGNGMTYSAISAMINRDIILGKKNPWTSVYDPKRLPTAKQLMRKGLDYGQELVQGAIRIVAKDLF